MYYNLFVTEKIKIVQLCPLWFDGRTWKWCAVQVLLMALLFWMLTR